MDIVSNLDDIDQVADAGSPLQNCYILFLRDI